MNRIAIVVHRCHPTIAGGAEALAVNYAELLGSEHSVDILTTCSDDLATWENVFPEGWEYHKKFRICRFSVTIQRPSYWHEIHGQLRPFLEDLQRRGDFLGENFFFTSAFQEEFVRFQGPFCEEMFKYIRQNVHKYDYFLFLTYIYPTTYFGSLAVPSSKAIVVPTLHDEPYAYMPIYRDMARRARLRIWLTQSEERFGSRLWGKLPGKVVSMAVPSERVEPVQLTHPYILYCGRIEVNKGCDQFIDYFIKYKKDNPSDLKLVLTGKDVIGLPYHPDIDFRGFVTESEKLALMAGANVFVMPSPFESFSIATLEAMGQQTPVLVNQKGDVLVEHVIRSGAGLTYSDYASFSQSLNQFQGQSTLSEEMGVKGRAYVLQEFSIDAVRSKLLHALKGGDSNALADTSQVG